MLLLKPLAKVKTFEDKTAAATYTQNHWNCS
jgi:hypothetical protein